MKGTYLGEFEEIVLLVVGTLRDQAYGVSVKHHIQDQLNRSTTLSAVHSALHRLEGKGFVASTMGEATHVRGGKRKRIFNLTSEGKAALAQSREIREGLWKKMETISTGLA